MFERVFKLSEHKTTVKTEVMAGITTFMTMAYILAVNPSVLGSTGMDTTAVLLATALASCLGTLCMAFMANLPFALSAGMGLNAFMAYTVVAGYGYSWQVALLAVFIEGLIFIVLSLTNVREAIFNAIPLTLKKGVSVGIGLFIAFIGLQNSGLCVDSATLVGIISFPENFHTAGICALLTLIGLFFKADFSDVVISLGGSSIKIGEFVNSVINFLIVAFVLFVVIKFINGLHKKPAAPAAPCLLYTSDAADE